ncbi:MutS protein msh5 [Gamsiella multidivaricata]|nr:MutS protein msh5 [Gamsiella multidivaricata]
MSRPTLSEMDESVQREAQLHLSSIIDLQSVESAFGIAFMTRHQSVECFTRTENQPTVAQFSKALSHIKNIPKILQAMPRKATIAEWQALLQFIYYSLKIYSASHEILVGGPPIIQEMHQQFVVKDLMAIGTFIEDVLDFDESVIEGRCTVKHNVDEELDRMRQTYRGLDSFLSEIAKEISLTIPSDFTSTINVIYFPQLGYLITVPMNPNWKTDQDFHLEGLSYQFSTESTVYYKNSAMRELDEHLGDIHGLIVDREIDILQGLQERIMEYSQVLVACSDLCAELDVLVSFAQVARLRNYRRPRMTEQSILHIMNGRHPLQELVVGSFVANNTWLGEVKTPSSMSEVTSNPAEKEDQALTNVDADTWSQEDGASNNNRIMILSGANSSGKSVYLKQVALIVYMAHIGSFVPAESAVIGVTDKILTRLQTRETVSSIQSAFMTDLQQVTLAIKMATRRSLVVLDEFGKGTASTDGAGMFCAVIEHFAKRTHDQPRVLATTHFHELFDNQLLDLSLPISLFTMEVYQEPNCLEATFLFRVIPGKAPSSLGPACAAMASLPAKIVQRGAYLSGLFRRYEMVIPTLTEHETKMQQMYETLTGMLLRLDLDCLVLDESTVKAEDDDGQPYHGDTEQRAFATASSNFGASLTDTRDSNESTRGSFSSELTRTTLGKRKGRENFNYSETEGHVPDTEGHRIAINETLSRAIDKLLEYAELVARKEREQEEYYDEA